MNVEVVRDTHTIVRVDGEIDLSNAAEFEGGLNEAADEAPQGFIIDMAGVAYIDSAGVQALLRVYAAMRESDGRLAVAVGNTRIKSVLEVVDLDRLPGIRLFDSLDAARKSLPAMQRALSRNP